MKRSPRFHRRLVISSLIGAIPLIILSIVLWNINYREQSEVIQQSNQKQARIAAAYVYEWLSGNIRILRSFDATIAAQNRSNAKVKELIGQLTTAHPEWENIAYADNNGQVVAAKLPQYPFIGDRSYFLQAKQQHRVAITDTLKSRVTGHLVVVIAYPIIRHGQFAGVIYVSIPLQKLQHAFSLGKNASSGNLSLWALSDHTLIAHSGNHADLLGCKYRNLPVARYSSSAQFGSYIAHSPTTGKLCLVGFDTVPNTNWVVVSSTPFRKAQSANIFILLGVSVLVLIFGFVWSYRSHYIISQQIRQLAESAHKIGEGNFSTQINLPWENDLSNFARLLNRLAVNLQEIEQLKSDLLSMVSHELKTPLTSIRTSLELIVNGIIDAKHPRYNELVRIAERQSYRLEMMIENLLLIARQENGGIRLTPSSVCLADVIESAVRWHRQIFVDRQLMLTISVPHDLYVTADADAMALVMNNLIDNAVRFTDAGHIDIHAAVSEDAVTLTVVDTGVGIPSADLPRIFDSFYQIPPSVTHRVGGAGLGLSVTKMLIEAHQGRVFIESAGVGHGCTVGFSLPHAHATDPHDTGTTSGRLDCLP
ncbi:MAG TPA: sensor histidine kinase [Armatimonadota bacterium]|nr:sensor histidine kinase [Armatimonadota bacterium]